jgi:hypothetical protein
MNEVILILSCVGLTTILMHGKILENVRCFLFKSSFIKEMFKCPMCLGFHVGWILSVFYYLLFSDLIVLFIPFVSSLCSLYSEELLDLIGNLNNKLEKSVS